MVHKTRKFLSEKGRNIYHLIFTISVILALVAPNILTVALALVSLVYFRGYQYYFEENYVSSRITIKTYYLKKRITRNMYPILIFGVFNPFYAMANLLSKL